MGPNDVSLSEGSVADGNEEGAFGCQYLTLSLAIEPVICHLSDMLHLSLNLALIVMAAEVTQSDTHNFRHYKPHETPSARSPHPCCTVMLCAWSLEGVTACV